MCGTYSKKKTHFHSANWMTTAPRSEPPAAPTGATAPKRAMPRLRFLPGGNVMPIKATILGVIRPPPIPQRALIKHIDTRLLEKPPQRAHMIHHRLPAVIMFLWPYIVPRRPPMGPVRPSGSR